MNEIEAAGYKRQIKIDFDRRPNYDDRTFYHYYGKKLVKLAPLKPGYRILDIATGTGIVAISAAKNLGKTGYIIGVDIAKGMLEKAQEKIAIEGLKNIELKEVDAEEIEFKDNSFDGIFCSLALIYLTNIPAALEKWNKWLKPGGFVAFNAWSENAFYPSILFRSILRKYGVKVPEPNQPLGTPERCYNALKNAGFQEIKIHEDVSGWDYFPDAETALSTWESNSKNVFGYQVFDLPTEQLKSCKREFIVEFKKIKSSNWCDATAYFAIACK